MLLSHALLVVEPVWPVRRERMNLLHERGQDPRTRAWRGIQGRSNIRPVVKELVTSRHLHLVLLSVFTRVRVLVRAEVSVDGHRRWRQCRSGCAGSGRGRTIGGLIAMIARQVMTQLPAGSDPAVRVGLVVNWPRPMVWGGAVVVAAPGSSAP